MKYITSYILEVKGLWSESKVHARADHEDPEGE